MSAMLKIAAVLALLAALFFGERYIEDLGAARQAAVDQIAIKDLKEKAAETLAAETLKTRNAEQALQAFTDAQNLKDADHEKTVADLHDQLRRAAGPAGRLRDPHATSGCGAGSGGATDQAASSSGDRPADGAEAGGLLSAELTGLLERLTREADDINAAYASCRAQAEADRAP